MKKERKDTDIFWASFAQRATLEPKQVEQFKTYSNLLLAWNEQINLTTIADIKGIIQNHFLDSLAIAEFMDITSLAGLCDVGSGAGFPGIPLKIKFPDLKVYLIEVVGKKVRFLQTVIDELGLTGIEVCPIDWRTFLRKTNYPIDLFTARASLPVDELVRLFKPSCPYGNALLVYWASGQWQPTDRQIPLVIRQEHYAVNHKKRKLVFFEKHIIT